MPYLRELAVLQLVDAVAACECRLNVDISRTFLRKAGNMNIYAKFCDIYGLAKEKHVCS